MALNRRDFLKALGLGSSASALAACGLDDNRYYTPVEQILPYVVKDEVHTPGTSTFFASVVTEGPHAYPTNVRHRDGRVVNVGANPRSPWPGAVPKAALLALQRHYSPDRFKGPRAREASAWSDVGWEAGLERLATAVRSARAAGKKVVWLGGYTNGSFAKLVHDYTGGEAVFYEPLGYEAEVAAAEALFGQRLLPAYDISPARYVLSFGAAFLGNWGNTRIESQYAVARDPNHGHSIVRFALIAPHQDQTGANCDDWYAVQPGAQALVARAIARLAALKLGYTGPALALLGDVGPKTAAEASGLLESDIDAIASQFAEASRAGGAVALPGGIAAAGKDAVDLAVATYLLNLLSGNGGKTFGVGPHYEGAVHGFDKLDALVADMNAGRVGVLLLGDTNPIYALPKGLGFDAALAKVDLVASLSSHPSETNAAAHLVLPTLSAFEDWGDEQPEAGVYLLRQPGMRPIPETDRRCAGDILLGTARAAGLQPPVDPTMGPIDPLVPSTDLGFTPDTFADYVAWRWQRELFPKDAASGQSWDDWWYAKRQDGFFAQARALAEPTLVAASYGWNPPVVFDGSGDKFLVVYPHPILGDGTFSNEPWAQETPDPMTGHVWDSFLLVSEKTCEAMGLVRNDQVEIATPHGKLLVGVEPYPALRDDTVALAFGQGHTALGRYASYGINAVDLLGIAKGGANAFAWQQVKASITKTGDKAALVSVMGHNRLHGRPFAPEIDAEALAVDGDAPAAHPGHLTGIHHAPWDSRLEKAGIHAFYEAPDHPVHRFALTVDTNACNGCGVCAIACYSENNLPVVGKDLVRRGKEMNWLRINRYWSEHEGQPAATFLPMMCQQCSRAPCESVCPVLATYHNHEGLNAMVYNRCVGTRYCANNCPYQVRRFNFHSYHWPEPFNLQLNPDAPTRTMGVMEKCTFCVQRTRAMKSALKDHGHIGAIPDDLLRKLPACAEACPSQALTFGNLNDEASVPAQTRKSGRSYLLLAELLTEPGVNYLGRASFHVKQHGVEHLGAATDGHGDPHSEPAPSGAGAH